jgi:predicted N-acetyltransferase YhbS
MNIQIRPLRKSDDRSNFKSGNSDLDHFFRRYAGQNQFRHHIGVTYIATDDKTIFGYATLAMASIEAEKLPGNKKIHAKYPLPVLRLGRLAVDIHFKGQKIGSQLLRCVFLLALKLKTTAGCVGIVIDAKPEAVEYYRQFGFQIIEEIVEGAMRGFPPPKLMFLPIKSIPAA